MNEHEIPLIMATARPPARPAGRAASDLSYSSSNPSKPFSIKP